VSDLTVSRRERLRNLENEIRGGMEEFYRVGMMLKEIRDDELYTEDGFKTWDEYLKARWEFTKDYCNKMIRGAEYRKSLPNTTGIQWSERSVRELTRIPDKREAARVAAKVLKTVEQSEKEAAKKEPGKNGKAKGKDKPVKLTASTVRKFVDAELGVDRAKKAKETKRKREEESEPELHKYLDALADQFEVETEKLATVNEDGWKQLGKSRPNLIKRLVAACDALAALLRKVDAL
jgi:hypothetical protein